MAEETGLEQLSFPWGALYRETAPYGRGKVARYYLAQTAQERITLPVNPQLGRPEHHEYRWVSTEAARRLLPARLQPVLKWVCACLHEQ